LAGRGRKYGGASGKRGITKSSHQMQAKLKEQIEIDIDRYNQDNYEKEKRIMLKALIPNTKSLAGVEDFERLPDLEKILTTEEYDLVKNHLAIINYGRLENLKPETGTENPYKCSILKGSQKLGFTGLDSLGVLKKVKGEGKGSLRKSEPGSVNWDEENFDPGLEAFLEIHGAGRKEFRKKPKKRKARSKITTARPQKPKPEAKPTEGNIAKQNNHESTVPNISDIRISQSQSVVKKVRFH
jgi:hypothetical protein